MSIPSVLCFVDPLWPIVHLDSIYGILSERDHKATMNHYNIPLSVERFLMGLLHKARFPYKSNL